MDELNSVPIALMEVGMFARILGESTKLFVTDEKAATKKHLDPLAYLPAGILEA